jgi:hypothetical protein
MFANLRKHYTEAEIVELALFVAYFVGFGRFGAVLDMVEELPKGLQDRSTRVVPWGLQEPVVVRG